RGADVRELALDRLDRIQGNIRRGDGSSARLRAVVRRLPDLLAMLNIKLRLARRGGALALLVLVALPVQADIPGLHVLHRHQKADTPKGPAMVVAANPLAVDAGLEILKKGGKAIDAAVAIQ